MREELNSDQEEEAHQERGGGPNVEEGAPKDRDFVHLVLHIVHHEESQH